MRLSLLAVWCNGASGEVHCSVVGERGRAVDGLAILLRVNE